MLKESEVVRDNLEKTVLDQRVGVKEREDVVVEDLHVDGVASCVLNRQRARQTKGRVVEGVDFVQLKVSVLACDGLTVDLALDSGQIEKRRVVLVHWGEQDLEVGADSNAPLRQDKLGC